MARRVSAVAMTPQNGTGIALREGTLQNFSFEISAVALS
jgi:hypothetical protein